MTLQRVVRIVLGKTRKERRALKAAFLEQHGSLNGYALYEVSNAEGYSSQRRSSFTAP